MHKMALVRWFAAGCLIFVLGMPGITSATPINLNDFYADPTVSVAVDGSSATISENPLFFSSILSNDPYLGDPNVIIPGSGVHLTFDYIFTEGLGNDDEFGAFLIDSNTGFSLGPAYEVFFNTTGSGKVDWDLSGITSTLGLQFELSRLAMDGGNSDSFVTISNISLIVQSVSEPPSILLLGFGMFVFLFGGRHKTTDKMLDKSIN